MVGESPGYTSVPGVAMIMKQRFSSYRGRWSHIVSHTVFVWP